MSIVGRVGSGKSSLINALLGEMNKSRGDVKYNGTLAFIPQEAWILNASLRNNILFGFDYDEERYNKIIKICELVITLS